MRRALRAVPSTFVVGLVAAAIASAAPSPRPAPPRPTPTQAPRPAATGLITEDASVAGPVGEVQEDEGPDEDHPPDPPACEGLTGLDNAICRHEQHPREPPNGNGPATSLDRLEENEGVRDGGRRSGTDRGEDHEVGGTGPGNSGGTGGGNGNGGGLGNDGTGNGHGSDEDGDTGHRGGSGHGPG